MKNTIIVDWDTCQECETCPPIKNCKFRAILRVDMDSPPVIESSRCNGCGLCILLCPYHAIIQPNGLSTKHD